MKATPLLLALSLLSLPAPGADLRNQDDRAYEIRIVSGASTTTSSIGANTTRTGVCSKCKLVIEGVGEVELSGSETATIKGGKVKKS